jgi:hydroxyacylglutathione hydrolase
MFSIEAIKAFNDNYIWCLYNHDSREAIVVDPGDAKPVEEYLTKNQLKLVAIVITHHHFDHTGGIEQLLSCHDVPVHGPHNPAIPHISNALSDTDTLTTLNLTFNILTIPGHTLDHIAFYCPQSDLGPLVFCGDTLFAGGCGRIFEGTPSMMRQSLNKLAALPPETKVYCAHEYTLSNLDFAQAVEPSNSLIKQRIDQCQSLREQGMATIPSKIETELSTNPFLRSDEITVINSANAYKGSACSDADQVFSVIREWKNHY